MDIVTPGFSALYMLFACLSFFLWLKGRNATNLFVCDGCVWNNIYRCWPFVVILHKVAS